MCRSKRTPPRRGFLFQGGANELRTVRPDPHHPGVLSRFFWAGLGMGLQRFSLYCIVVFLIGVSGIAHAGRMWIATDGTLHAEALSACEATANPNFEIRVLSISALSGGRYRAICSYKTGGLSSYNVSTTGECF